MRALLLVWICGAALACRGTAERGGPAEQPGAPRAGGWLRIVYDIDLGQALTDRAAVIRRDLEARLAEEGLGASVRVSDTLPGALRATPRDAASRAALEGWLRADYSDALERRACEAPDGPEAICLQLAASFAATLRASALGTAAKTIRERLEAVKAASPSVLAKGEQIVVELPAGDPQTQAIRSLIARPGTLELKVVDNDAALMKSLYAHVRPRGSGGASTEPRALEEGISADIDTWQVDGHPHQTDYYLTSHDRDTLSGRSVLERYLAELAAKDPAQFQIPEDRQIGYQRIDQPDAKDPRPYWRTYYLERDARLTGSSISNAEGTFDPYTNRPMILLDFNRAGAAQFGELTARMTGKKLAIVVDGKVQSAPVIHGAIRGGRASITMGGGPAAAQVAERDELVNALRTGALPAPLRVVSETLVP